MEQDQQPTNTEQQQKSPPRQQEPEHKKTKMSSSSTISDDEAPTSGAGDTTTTTKKQRYKRRKIAIFFAYCGVGYQGMQKNPGAKTIEGDLEEALYQAGGVPDSERDSPPRHDWGRSPRTDKGVSAVGQVVSGRFYVDPPGFIERLNANLSEQIKIFGFKRVTASFNAKKFCDRRRYVYLLPVFALDPSAHRDRESVLASLGSGNELVKCLECSERGRKVFGVIGKRNFDAKQGTVQSDISSNSGGTFINEGVEEQLRVVSDENDRTIALNGEENANVVDSDSTLVANDGGVNSGSATDSTVANEEVKVITGSGFSYGEKEKERFNRILKYYVGSHNFHNFTTRTKAEDPSANRYIVSFNANTTLVVDGIEFIKCEVVGQSFMLHQIRKMMGLAVAVMRGCASESIYETAFEKNVSINVPTAPEVGLYLDECLFTSYNQKWRDSHEDVSMKAYAEEAEDFKMKYIYSYIASTEHKEGAVSVWLHSLNHRNYPDLRGGVNHSETTDEKAVEVNQTIDEACAEEETTNKKSADAKKTSDEICAEVESTVE